MFSMPRQAVVLGIGLVCAAASVLVVLRSKPATVNLAFWFESISDDARKTVSGSLGDGISAGEMAAIETISREEIVRAFREYPIAIIGRGAALYHVRVIDSLNSASGGSAESYVLPGMGGQGYVNFRSLAHGAATYAPPGVGRDEFVAAIGLGIGRAAVHEFTHQLLGRDAPIDSSQDIQSYEYGSTLRREQYYGDVRWDLAAPMLREKFGLD